MFIYPKYKEVLGEFLALDIDFSKKEKRFKYYANDFQDQLIKNIFSHRKI